MKVVHFLKHFEPGGIEKWLVDLNRENYENGNKLELYYFLQTKDKAYFDDEIEDYGGKLIHTIYSRSTILSYLCRVYFFLKKEKIDVIHSHFYYFSGLIMLVAFFAGVKVRVCHCHNDKSSSLKNASFIKKKYLALLMYLNRKFSTENISVSSDSAKAFFGSSTHSHIVPCGLRFEDFEVKDSQDIDRPIKIVNVASFSYQKNHKFMLELAVELKKRKIKFQFRLVGVGDLYDEFERDIQYYELQDSFILEGRSKKVQEILSEKSDLFIFPSHFEGLGLAAIESQYFGLHTLVSDTLPKELDVSSYIKFLPINTGVDIWCDYIEKIKKRPINQDVIKAREYILDSNMSINKNFSSMLDIYGYKK